MPQQVEEGFTIKIRENPHGYAVKMESSLGSEEYILQTNFQDLTYYLRLRELRESLQSNCFIDKTLPRGYIKEFGKELFKTLFTEEMKHLLKKCFEYCLQKGTTLRILLESDSLSVHEMPWEIMYFEEEKLFLGASSYITFSRSIPGIPILQMDEVSPPLKLLVLVSSPLDLPSSIYPIDIGEVEQLLNPLEDLKSKGFISMKTTDDTRFDHIRTLLKEGWNVIHFVGHGSYHKGKTFILIDNDKRNQYLLPAEKVPDLFESEKRPNLIIFSACESAQVPFEIHSGIPFILLKRGFPAVIAMQYSALVEVADTFVKYLYERIGKMPLDKAVSEARMIICNNYGEDTISWFTPVLYVSGFAPVLQCGNQVVVPSKMKRVDFLRDLPRAPQFFGRRKQRLEIEELFEKKRRVITVVGIGGIGKSSLVREFADRFKENYKAVFATRITSSFSLKGFFGEMKEFLSANEDESFGEVADSDMSVGGKLEYLCRSLGMNRYLIVFDGVEDILKDGEIVSEDMKILLNTFLCGDHLSHVILTSRYPVKGYDEKVDVPDLSIWSCWRILREKKVDLEWGEMSLVYGRVRGNPKYYELLAPIIKEFGKENLLKAVKEARRDIDAWLLDELFGFISEERKVLEKVSVFRIPFRRNALEMAGGTDEVVRRLLDLSLLKCDELYSVHSIVRDYCKDKITKEEKKSAHEFAVEYYRGEKDFGKLLEFHYHLLKAGRYEEAANIAFGVTEALVTQGHLELAFDLNVSASWGTPKKMKSISYHHLGIIHQDRGEYEKAVEYFTKSLEISETLHDVGGIARTYHHLGIIHQDRGEYEKAVEYFTKSLEIKETLHDVRGIASTYHHLGMIHQLRGEYEKAVEYFTKSLEISEELHDVGGIASTYHHLGIIHQLRGEYEKAVEYFTKSLEISETLHDVGGIASTYHHLGIIHQDRGEYEKAVEYFTKSLEISETLHDVGGIASTSGQLGRLYIEKQEYEKALKLLLAAHDIFYAIHSPYISLTEKFITEIRHQLGEEQFETLWKKVTEPG